MAKRRPKKKRSLSAYNLHMQREMKKGRTFKQAVASWKGKSSNPRRRAGTVRRTVRRRPRTMAKKRRSRRGFLNTSTLMKFIRIGALVAPAAAIAMDASLSPQRKLNQGLAAYTGYNPGTRQFSFMNLAQGWLPFVATSLVTKGISKLMGIIRRI